MTNPHNKGKGRALQWMLEHVTYSGDDCLSWPMACDDKGYGELSVDGRRQKAPRMMCEMAHGPAPSPKHETAHSCGNGHLKCINPNHLSWKTRTENQRDRAEHGTAGKPGVRGRSKFTADQVAEIRLIGNGMSKKDLGIKFNASPSAIAKILNGERWKETPSWLRVQLSLDDVKAIQASDQPLRAIAKRYGLGVTTVSRIRQGKSYHHCIAVSPAPP